jgi:transposase
MVPFSADGYSVYERYAEEQKLTHALCWAHARRKFFDITPLCPTLAHPVLSLIAELYQLDKGDYEQRKRVRAEILTEKVESLFAYVKEKASRLTPQHPFTKASSSMLSRKRGLFCIPL